MASPLGAHCRLSRISPLSDRKKASAADLRTQASILQHFTREAEQGTAKCLRQTLPD